MSLSDRFDRLEHELEKAARSQELRQVYLLESPNLPRLQELIRRLAEKLLETKNLEQVSDFFWVTKENMNIEAIRKLRQETLLRPFKDYKIFVFESTEKFSVAIQNALLKTLEEPPPQCLFFILTSSAASLLPTVRSRAQCFFLPAQPAVSPEDNQEEAQAELFYSALHERDVFRLLAFMEQLKNAKDHPDALFDALSMTGRDLLVAGQGALMSVQEERQAFAQRHQESFTPFQLLRILAIIEDTRKKIAAHCNYALACEAMVLNSMEVVR